jgi:hypothetical protein
MSDWRGLSKTKQAPNKTLLVSMADFRKLFSYFLISLLLRNKSANTLPPFILER